MVKLPVKVWHMKNQKMLVLVKGITIEDEIHPQNYAGNKWTVKIGKERFTPETGRGPECISQIKNFLLGKNYQLPDDFGQFIPYEDWVVFSDQQTAHDVYVRVKEKTITVFSNTHNLEVSFYTGKSHRNYHFAMENALKLARHLRQTDQSTPTIP